MAILLTPSVGLNTPWEKDPNRRRCLLKSSNARRVAPPSPPPGGRGGGWVSNWSVHQTTTRMSLSGTHSSKPPAQVHIHQVETGSFLCSPSSDSSRGGATLVSDGSPSLSYPRRAGNWGERKRRRRGRGEMENGEKSPWEQTLFRAVQPPPLRHDADRA